MLTSAGILDIGMLEDEEDLFIVKLLNSSISTPGMIVTYERNKLANLLLVSRFTN